MNIIHKFVDFQNPYKKIEIIKYSITRMDNKILDKKYNIKWKRL